MRNWMVAPLAALALALMPMSVLAEDQPEIERVIGTVEAFMAAFDAKDADAMAALLAEGASVISVREAEGGDVTRTATMHDLVTTIAGLEADVAEPIEIVNVMVDGPVAMVWADYGFYADGERSHCGVDLFTLVRVDGEWKIATTTYSHITSPCEDAPTP